MRIQLVSSCGLVLGIMFTVTMTNASGAGFYLSYVGSPSSLGTAGVANPTNTIGADASWTNPAGMTGIEEQHVLGGLQWLLPKIEFDTQGVQSTGRPVTGNDGGNAGIMTPVPSFFYVRPLSERVRLGFSLTGPLGGGLDYGNRFVGRYSVQNVVLAGLGATPALSYKVNDKLSVGAGITVLYTLFNEKIAVRQPLGLPDATVSFEDLTDWGVQGILGLTYEFSDRLLLGLVYRSQADTDLEGDVNVENWRLPVLPPDDIKISWTNPQWLEAGLRYEISDKTALFLNAGWQEWSKFSENTLAVDGNVTVLDRNWDNTWEVGIALAHKLSNHSILSAGLTYESSPVKDKYRTLDFPLDEQVQFSAGYGWTQSDSLSMFLGGALVVMANAPVDQTSQGVRVRGDFDSNWFAILGGTLRYTF